MTEASSDLERRLTRLERENRRFRRGGAVLLVAAAAALLMAQGRPSQTVVEAREFVVRDASGNTRAVLGLDEAGEPRLALYDAGESTESAWLGVMDGVPALSMQDRAGTFQSQLTQGVFYVQGSRGSMLLDLEAPDLNGGLSLRDWSGQARARLNWPADGVNFVLLNRDGVVRAAASVDAADIASFSLPLDDRPGVQLFARDRSLGLLVHDPQGRLRFGLDVPSSGEANLAILAPNGETLFGVP